VIELRDTEDIGGRFVPEVAQRTSIVNIITFSSRLRGPENLGLRARTLRDVIIHRWRGTNGDDKQSNHLEL
jgi:hypothetical protein